MPFPYPGFVLLWSSFVVRFVLVLDNTGVGIWSFSFLGKIHHQQLLCSNLRNSKIFWLSKIFHQNQVKKSKPHCRPLRRNRRTRLRMAVSWKLRESLVALSFEWRDLRKKEINQSDHFYTPSFQSIQGREVTFELGSSVIRELHYEPYSQILNDNRTW